MKPKRYLLIILSILSISLQLSFAKEHNFLSGSINHIPEHLGGSVGGLIGGSIGEPIPGPSTGLIGVAIGELIGNAIDDEIKEEKEKNSKKRKHHCIENPYLIRCADED